MRVLVAFSAFVCTGCSQSVTPFTLVEVSRGFDPSGRPKSEAAFLVAVNRDGSRAIVDLDPAAGKVRQILDAGRGTNTVVNPVARSVSTSRYRQPRNERSCHEPFHSFTGATVSVENSAGKIHGIEVQRVSVDSPGGRGFDVFMAPSLGCQLLRSVMRDRGMSLETTTTRDLRIGDPDPGLFEVPNDYRKTTFN